MRNILQNKWFLGFLIVGGSAFALWMKAEPVKPTCENISCVGCDCPEGFCKCVPGGKSCPACKHLRSHEEEHAAHQAKLLEQAKRAR